MSGTDVWRLYDTFGFPIDLTRLMAEERGFSLDEASVIEEETKAKELSRGARKGAAIDGEVVAFDVHDIGEIEGRKIPRTDDSFKYGIIIFVFIQKVLEMLFRVLRHSFKRDSRTNVTRAISGLSWIKVISMPSKGDRNMYGFLINI